jgi:hypothetical protein
MKQDSLSKFIQEIRQVWGPLNSELVAKSQVLMEKLASSPSGEAWIANIQGIENSLELYRDPEHGFILLAHIEKEGLYRAPHDHGNGWVVYAVQSGQMEMRTYGRLKGEHGKEALVRRDKYRMNPGEARAYLPGDIHDTRCISDSVLMLRLTSGDLKKEKREGRMSQYDGAESIL